MAGELSIDERLPDLPSVQEADVVKRPPLALHLWGGEVQVKTCKRGHPQDSETVYISPQGRAQCRACKRVTERKRNADPERRQKRRDDWRRAYYANPEKEKARTMAWARANPEKSRAIKLRYRERHLEQVRERDRIYQEAKRREAGAKARKITRPVKQGKYERLYIPAEPLSVWLQENVSEGDITRWSRGRGVDESLAQKIRDGKRISVHIDTVDRMLDDPWLLHELYPLKDAA